VLIPALAAFVTAVAGATTRVDTGCGLEIGREDVESYIALSAGPPADTVKAHKGVIEVLDSNKTRLGYISRKLSHGEAMYDPVIDNALVVTFATSPETGNTKFDLTATNMDPSYPFLGLIQGYPNDDSNLKPNSWQYLEMGGIKAPGTKPGAPPSAIGNSFTDVTGRNLTAESAVWEFDPTSKVLIPRWINTDGSLPHEDLVVGPEFILYVCGSKDAFHNNFNISVSTIGFRFVAT